MIGAEEWPGEPTIVQYWHSKEIPDYIAEQLATLPERNPRLRHLVFDERTAADLIAERLGERHERAFRACAVPAMQADYFRYCAVLALGGIYIDADMACAQPLDSLLDREGRLFEFPGGPVLNGYFAFRSPGHRFMAMSVEVATSNIERRASESVGLATGPLVFTGLIRAHRLGSLEAVRCSADGSRWGPLVNECWPQLAKSFRQAIEMHGPLSEALVDVQISDRAEALALLERPEDELPYKSGDDYWANWQGSIFRPGVATEVR